MPSAALMIRRPPRSTPLYSSAASDVYKRQDNSSGLNNPDNLYGTQAAPLDPMLGPLYLIHISEPTRLRRISYAVCCFNKTASPEIYTSLFVGSVRCV